MKKNHYLIDRKDLFFIKKKCFVKTPCRFFFLVRSVQTGSPCQLIMTSSLWMALTSSRREYYIFSGPPCRIIQKKIWKINLAIQNFSVNETKSGQPNKCLLIDISRIKWLFFFYGRLSSAQLDRWQAPKQWPSIDQRLVEQTGYLT